MITDKRIYEMKNAIEMLNKYCNPGSDFCENLCPIEELCYLMFDEAPSEWIHEKENKKNT